MKQCTNIGCTAKVKTQWAAISAAQQASFTAGIVIGLPAGAIEPIQELLHMATNPGETYQALKGLFTSGNILGNVSDAVKESYINRLNKLEEEYQRAGAGGSYNAGIETGKLLLDMAALATGAGGAAKAGIKVTEKAITKVANAAKKEVIEAGKAAEKGASIAGKGTSVDSKKIVDINAGSKGEWNKLLNKPEPNTIYKVDGNKVYHTDELGRVSSVESDLNLLTKDRNIYQQCKAGRCGIEGDEGGHLLASIFNGPGEKLNLVPMNSNLNRGAWKQMENTWAKALKDGKNVKVKIEPVYNSNSVRPERFKVSYSIDGSRPIIQDFKNAPGGI
ncbi:DNA/RNA non-specific endonuclease [Snodgrassella gandavensis]|uniref:DNA/RNA non-specific endonuclease n=1 Tax=Snodgrassella gandavensis TaxID=2946698 RepID=UPI001EF3D6E9|nr:DNA/RNA non-specific endonuclease [Snodgrassella gandavensis]